MLSRFARLALKILGWRWEGGLPPDQKLVLIVAPHTSNWDLPVGILFKWALKIDCNYLAKHTVFWPPLSWFFNATGAIPVFRHEHRNVVAQVADMFAERERLWLAIAPAGTRSKTDHWKSGFYYMALEAKVPLLPIILDFDRKVMAFGPLHHMTGQVSQDMDRIRAFFDGSIGHRNELSTPVRLSVEDSDSNLAADAASIEMG